jgi:hypothetical protein
MFVSRAVPIQHKATKFKNGSARVNDVAFVIDQRGKLHGNAFLLDVVSAFFAFLALGYRGSGERETLAVRLYLRHLVVEDFKPFR